MTYQAEAARVSEAVPAVFGTYGLDDDDATRALTGLWTTVHGFVTLEVTGGLAGLANVDGTFDRLVATFARDFGSTGTQLPTWAAGRRLRPRRKR